MAVKGQFKISPELAAKDLAELGTATAVASKHGISESSVSRALSSKGIKLPRKLTDKAVIAEAIRLYVDCELSCTDIGPKLGICPSTVARNLKKLGLTRTPSEAHALQVRNKGANRSKTTWWQSTKTGAWEPADSRYEIARMSQLDNDQAVITWTRRAPTIKYGDNKTYLPDFIVNYADGTVCIEEIKPKSRVQKEMVENGKLEAAMKYANKNGMLFKIVTEDEIGAAYIRDITMAGLHEPEESERLRRKQETEKSSHNKHRAKRNARSRDWYYKNRERANANTIARRRAKKIQAEILTVWSIAL